MRFVALTLQKRGVDSEEIYVSMERNMRARSASAATASSAPTSSARTGRSSPSPAWKSVLGIREV